MSSVALSLQEFQQQIHQLFQQWRKGRFAAASLQWFLRAPLLQSASELLPLTNAAPSNDTVLVKLCLMWTVEQLRPAAGAAADPKRVRDFTILSAYYQQGRPAKDVYYSLGGTESNFRTHWCKEATATAAELLYHYWDAPAETAISQQWQRYVQIHQLPSGVQRVLQLLAVSTIPWPTAWLMNLPQHLAAPLSHEQQSDPIRALLTEAAAALANLPVQEAIHDLINLGWLQPASAATAMTATATSAFTPAVRARLVNSLTAEEVKQGHRLAAHCALLAQAPITAAYHWLQIGANRCAAHLLLHSGQVLLTLDNNQEEMPLEADAIATLAHLLRNLSPQAFEAPVWGRLKRLCGRVAQIQAAQPQQMPPTMRATLRQSAITEYQEALLFLTDRAEKATVHYQLATLSLPLDSALADQHLRQCITLLTPELIPALTPEATNTILLVRVYIQYAWLSIQHRPALTAAEANLKQARLLLDTLPMRDLNLWSDWYNAWGTLCFCKGAFSKGVEALAMGIELLREQPNQIRFCKMLHNQGLEFSTQHPAEQKVALHYLHQSLAIALRMDHTEMQMLCYKAIGGCYFHLQQYAEAIRFYEQAYVLIPTDSDFKVHLCYDLAEAHAMQVEPAAAITYFRQGFTLARQMGLQELLAAYHDLAAQAPWLWLESYKPRMAVAIRLLLSNNQIKSQEYAQAAHINEKTALKDLQAWVAQKILHQNGKARATTYAFKVDKR
ncbi:MAG: hypothetical protein DYG89_30160 [Caldilinea sp. CFX5]|nr:hypothetical protein [Caldilinea sp. CFX5]